MPSAQSLPGSTAALHCAARSESSRCRPSSRFFWDSLPLRARKPATNSQQLAATPTAAEQSAARLLEAKLNGAVYAGDEDEEQNLQQRRFSGALAGSRPQISDDLQQSKARLLSKHEAGGMLTMLAA